MPRRRFVYSAAYKHVMESALANAADRIARDIFRRAGGYEPLIPDFMIHQERTGELAAVVGLPLTVPDAEIIQAVRSKRRIRRTA